MAHQVLRYHGPNHVPGLPASHQTDEDLALLAQERGTTVEKLTQEFLSYQGNGGKPLYTLTAKGAFKPQQSKRVHPKRKPAAKAPHVEAQVPAATEPEAQEPKRQG